MPRVRFNDPEHTRVLASPSWSHCEGLIQAFETAWKAGQTPDIRAFIKADGRARRALTIELIHVDLEFRVKSGTLVGIEYYLNEFPDLATERRTVMELIAAEFDLRRKNGSGVGAQDYASRFPQFRSELLVLLGETPSEDDRPTLPGGTATEVRQARPSIPGYEILEEIGRGGMGLVYKAHEKGLGRLVALKVLPADYAGDPERLERFIREARTASALNHPNICTVHALGREQGCPYIVMELIEGQTLRTLLGRRPGWQEICRILRQAARALAAAHRVGVVHRDIKPENIMVRGDGYAKVLDFGLARRLPQLGVPESGFDTDPGALIGTVAFMSPEQAHGEEVGSASDIFSLGVVLYQMTTGMHPFERGTNLATLNAIAHEEPLSLQRVNPDLPLALEGLIRAMLHKNASLRPTAEEVEVALGNLSSTPAQRENSSLAGRAIVPRERELGVLRAALLRAEAGEGTIVSVAGEPGIGKTTLTVEFLESLHRHGTLIGRGNCSERRADTEAYLPIIDALEDLVRRDASGTVVRLLQVVAPSWYAQMGFLHGQAASSTESPRATSQQAMLREFRTLVQEASRLGTVVLFLDDVHWADVPTVDLLAHLGHHAKGMRLLVLATCRSTELLLGPHPFHIVRQELGAKEVCIDLPLGFLERADIDRYLALSFQEHGFPADFADLIYARTEGSPLFMVDLLRYLRERGVIAKIEDRWQLAREVPDLRHELPGSVRGVIQRKLLRLGDGDRRLLSAASVQGPEFDSAAVAAALGWIQADVEDRFQVLDRIHGLIRPLREHEFPDGTATMRYAFVHILYQQALHGDLPPARRAALSLALARALEAFHPDKSVDAAELACLYEVGRDISAAARLFRSAADNAARVFAHNEAISLARRGLRLLEKLATDSERVALELPLQTILGLQLQVTRGFADPEARHAYTRARELCEQAENLSARFPVLWGLWLFSKVRSELPRAQNMAEELLALARELNDPDLALQAHQALGITAFCRGLQTSALHHVEQASALYDPSRHRTHAFLFGQDPGVICTAFGAVSLLLLGYPDQAVQQSDRAISMSFGLSPSSQAVALHFAAMLHQMRGDIPTTLERARASGAIAREHGLSFWRAGAMILEGWAVAMSNDGDDGIELMQQGLHDWLATDSVTYHTYHLGLLADVLGHRKRIREALRILEEALALVEQTGEELFEPELFRLRAEILMRSSSESTKVDQVGNDLQRSVLLSRRQQTRFFELRTILTMLEAEDRLALSLHARMSLDTVLRSFREGFDTVEVRKARTILG